MLDGKKRAGVAATVAAGLVVASSAATAYADSYSWNGTCVSGFDGIVDP